MNALQAYRLAGSILGLDFQPARALNLHGRLPHTISQWQLFVQTASNELMLPPVYSSLKRHQLLPFLPEDLSLYLAEVYQLNLERNQKILLQLQELKNQLGMHQIPFVVLKGTGNMLDGIYQDAAERMVYDIDILVPQYRMIDAAQLLLQEGYHSQKPFNPRAMESTMHYPILLREDHVAGVEIHRMPVQYLYQDGFPVDAIFQSAVSSRQIPGFLLMDIPHRIIHNFLHAQLMHSGHFNGRVGLRDMYDLLLLSREVAAEKVFQEYGQYTGASLAWQKMVHHSFELPMPESLKNRKGGEGLIRRHAMVMHMGRRKRRLYMISIMLVQKYIILPFRILWNRQARNYVFARLTDRGWYGRHLKGMRHVFGLRPKK